MQNSSVRSTASKYVFVTFLCLLVTASSLSQKIYNSVVQIEVNGKKRGIGVVVGQSDLIVTALHVVAGIKNIMVYSEYAHRSVPATVIKIHKESDLALLQLSTRLNLPAIQVSTEIPDANNAYFIYGYTSTPEIIRFKMGLADKIFELSSLIAPTTPQHQWLINHGFPLPSAKIIRLGNPIQHGDSGSPIVNSRGELVGIADGGLKKGAQRMNWGISAREHVGPLFKSEEYPHIGPSTLPFLKNARAENPLYTSENDLALYFIFEDSLENIVATSDAEDQNFIAGYRNSGFESSSMDIYKMPISVYEDYNTGATIAIPQALDFEYNSNSGLLRAWSPSGNVELNILIKQASSYSEAVSRVNEFQDDIVIGDNWHERTEGNYYENDDYNELYDESINLTRYNEYSEEVSSLIAEILIDDSFVIATSVTVYDTTKANSNPIDWYYTYAMEACLVLTGFALY